MADKDENKKGHEGAGKRKAVEKKGSAFDNGNELLLKHAEKSRSKLGAIDHISPGSSMLDKAEKRLEKEKQKRESEDEAAQAAIRGEAVRARDKVVILMQQMMSNPDEMQALASITDRMAAATQVVEMLAPYLKDTELDALAAYDHDDITFRMIICAESYVEVKNLTAQALKFGAFGTVLWQMAYDELSLVAVAKKKKEDEEEESVIYDTEPVRTAMMAIIGFIRLVRSSDRL